MTILCNNKVLIYRQRKREHHKKRKMKRAKDATASQNNKTNIGGIYYVWTYTL